MASPKSYRTPTDTPLSSWVLEEVVDVKSFERTGHGWKDTKHRKKKWISQKRVG